MSVFGQFWTVWDGLKLFFEAQKTALFLDIMGLNPPVFRSSGKHPEFAVYLDEMAIKTDGREGAAFKDAPGRSRGRVKACYYRRRTQRNP